MTKLATHTSDAARLNADATREVLYQSETTRIYRLHLPTAAASIVCKEPLGANALERLRHEKKIIALLADHGIVSVSIGVTAWLPSAQLTAEQMFAMADAALYEAKQSGRNRVVGKQRDSIVSPQGASYD